MRKINPLLVFGGLSASLFVFRVTELFLINDSGVVKPWWMILPVYFILAAAAVLVFLFVKKSKSEENTSDFSLRLSCEIILLIFSFLLLCEGLASLLRHLAWDATTVAAISGINSFVFFAVSFLLRRLHIEKPARITALLGFVEITVYLVAISIEIFVANGTSLSLNLNLLSLISFICQLFLFKSLAREFVNAGTEDSFVSLRRSALMLVTVLPAEIIGQTLTRTGLLSDFPAPPFRNSFVEIIISACLLVLAGCVLVAKEKNKEEPSQEVIEE